MANVTRNRPGGCGCRQALNNGVTYANMNYAASEHSDWPFYNGPCPGTRPINGCPGWCRGTNGLPCGALGGGPAAQAYGFFSHVGALSLAAGSGVPFNGPSQAQGMAQDYTQIRIEQAGLYLLEYRLTWPVAAVTNARFTLLANGEAIPGSDARFMADTAGTAHSVSAQVLVPLCAQSAVSLVSDTALQITPNAPADTVATLSIVRLG